MMLIANPRPQGARLYFKPAWRARGIAVRVRVPLDELYWFACDFGYFVWENLQAFGRMLWESALTFACCGLELAWGLWDALRPVRREIRVAVESNAGAYDFCASVQDTVREWLKWA